MSTDGRNYSGPSATHAPSRVVGVGAHSVSGPPPRYTSTEPSSPYSGHDSTQWDNSYEERRPLLPSSPSPQSDVSVRAARLRILLVIVIIWPIAYFVYSLVFVPSQVALYKSLYDDTRVQAQHLVTENTDLMSEVDDARVQVQHLLKEKATLVSEVDEARIQVQYLLKEKAALVSEVDEAQAQVQRLLKEKVALVREVDDARVQIQHLLREKAALVSEVDDARVQIQHLLREKAALVSKVDGLRGQLSKAKVEAFWEIARNMDTNMDVWVGADDQGGAPKFWSYGITNGKYHDDDPPVTAIQVKFAAWDGTVVESTDKRRVVGYRVKSDRWNNGWWMATGLDEFGQSGNHRLQFSAREGPPHNGAWYEAVIFYSERT